MANEITYSSSISVTNGNLTSIVVNEVDNADQSTARRIHNSQTIGTTHEAIVMGDLATPRWARFKNLDSTNFVEIGVEVAATFYPVVKLLAGEHAQLPLSDGTYYAQADTASVELDCFILDS